MVESIPKSAAQKVQRFHLAERFGQQDKTDGRHELSSAEAGEEVRGAWADELGAPPRNSSDNFFGSGGGSMQAAALASNLSTRLGTNLESAVVFQQPVLRKLVDCVEDQLTEPKAQVRVT